MQFTFPHREGGNRRLTERFPILPITYYLKIETPQSAKAASSPKSGAKGLVFSCIWNCNERVVCRGD